MSATGPLRAVGLLGGGVIGGGWAARFLLGGIDVRLYDPDPESERKLGEMLENARRALDAPVGRAAAGGGRADRGGDARRRPRAASSSSRRARPSASS